MRELRRDYMWDEAVSYHTKALLRPIQSAFNDDSLFEVVMFAAREAYLRGYALGHSDGLTEATTRTYSSTEEIV